jgi:hypothetical protein
VTNEGAPIKHDNDIGSESISSVSGSWRTTVMPGETVSSKGELLKVGAVLGKALIVKE